MKIWVIKTANGKYVGNNHSIVPFGYARVFNGYAAAEKFAFNAKKIAKIGTMNVVCMDISEKKRVSIDEMLERFNNKDTSFVQDSENYKMMVVSKYGYLNSKFKGYETLEEHFENNIRKGALYKNFPQLYAMLQIRKAFVDVFPDGLLKIWMSSKAYKDEAECHKKMNELLKLYEGKNMEVCFLQ